MDNGAPVWTTVVTALVAVYGAGMSTWNFVQNWHDRKPRILVELAPGYVALSQANPPQVMFWDASPGNPRPDHLILLAANAGHVTVTFGACSLLLPDGRNVMPLNAPRSFRYPHPLLEGQSCSTCVPIRDLARTLASKGVEGKVLLVGEFKDQIGRFYRSKPFEFDVDAWSAEAAS